MIRLLIPRPKSIMVRGIFQLITDIGLLLFGASMFFYIITLPVEFNASRRAIRIYVAPSLRRKRSIICVRC